jgi:hypothetical protein
VHRGRPGVSRQLALWGFLPSEVLHGLTYAVMWSAVASYASGPPRIVPPCTALAPLLPPRPRRLGWGGLCWSWGR